MEDLDLIIEYLELLSALWDGCEFRFADGKILRRMNGIIWGSIYFIKKEDIDEKIIEGKEEL